LRHVIRPTPAGEEASEVTPLPSDVDESSTRVLAGGGDQGPSIRTRSDIEAVRTSASEEIGQNRRNRDCGSSRRHPAEKALEVEDPASITTLIAPGQDVVTLIWHKPLSKYDPAVREMKFSHLASVVHQQRGKKERPQE
jgi:hypothetical protein